MIITAPPSWCSFWFLFNTHNEATAKLAFIFDNESNLLVGAAAMGSDAGPWIDVLSLVIFNKMTREQFAYYIYAFPRPPADR